MKSKATVFTFTSHVFEPHNKRVLFNYKTEFMDREPLLFTETILLPSIPILDNIPKEVIDKLLQSLHIMLGVSYFKFYCPKEIKLPYALSRKEADFWNTVYKKGLGEFFYRNKLNPNISPKFPYKKNLKPTYYSPQTTHSRCLVGIGGGKDSIVVAELLKEYHFNSEALYIKTGSDDTIIKNIIKTAGMKNLVIERQFDPKIHQPHQYNGHIPISAIYAFLGLMAAIFYDYLYIVVGNEHSSNFGNIAYKDLEINHQWSKSFEFETLFQNYVKNNITPSVTYFSLLRPFYEIRIAKMFAKYKKYFPYFSSCNRNFFIKPKENRGLWCGECPKCVFVFTLLSAFLTKKELVDIFGKNLYENKALLPLFKDILGFGTMKPFDCVGTFKEAQTALFLAKKKFADTFIMRQQGKKATYYNEVFKTARQTLVPDQFIFLGMENALIVGFGKEGKVTKEYLKKYYPKLKIGIADEKQGKNYLAKQSDFDVAIKTPGIKKESMTIQYTTATNIFFSKVRGSHTIIGVTGSKGKSTTSSLIYHILKTAGQDVQLLGNIGQPMLETLLRPLKKGKIFVLELSSYQLDDIKFSPDISVITSLFPEHMDYHHGITNYYNAKKSIINFQNKDGYFVYNPHDKTILSWVKNYQGKAVPFAQSIPMKENDIPLIGEHNKNNIKAAISVAKILRIPNEKILQAIKSFKGLPHRLEYVGQYYGIDFYDDANAATPEATIMAIKSLKIIGTIFLGGQNRGYDFTQLEKTLKKYNIKNIVLFPDSGGSMLTSATDFNVLKTDSMKKAVAFAYKHTQKGSICLLSCASPSYSLWENFEQKGDEFKKFVRQLGKV